MKQMKMNTLLALVDHSSKVIASAIRDYTIFFKTKQGMFRGEKKTYEPRDGFIDDPTKRGVTKVTTTVDEKLNWLLPMIKEHLNDLFSIEATNSADAIKFELKVGDKSFGNVTALDLMRLKNILTDEKLIDMLSSIPVRSDAEVWEKSDNPDYRGRDVFETPLTKGVTRTTETHEEILPDPNIDPAHIPANYRPAITNKKTTYEIGDYTLQKFTGEWNQRQRAELLRRRSEVLEAAIAGLKEINDVQMRQPNLKVNDLIDYIIYGK